MYPNSTLHTFSCRYVLFSLGEKKFAWEWEGDLHRLFCDRSYPRVLVERRDPMTLGMNGAEVLRECKVRQTRRGTRRGRKNSDATKI